MKIKKTKYLLNTLGLMIGLWLGSAQATILWSEGVNDAQRQTSLSLSSHIEGVSSEWRICPAQDMKDVYLVIGRPSHPSSLQPQQPHDGECADIRAAIQKEVDREKENDPVGFFSQEHLEVQAINALLNLKSHKQAFCLDLIPQQDIDSFLGCIGIPSILLTAGKGFQFDSSFTSSEDSKTWQQWVVFATPSGDTIEDGQLELLHTIFKKENISFKEVIKGGSFQSSNPNAREGAFKRIQEMLEKIALPAIIRKLMTAERAHLS